MAQPGSALALGARCQRFKSSHPDNIAGLAQLVEHLICNQGVVGSIPTSGTAFNKLNKYYLKLHQDENH